MMMRLDKFLSVCTPYSRKDIRGLVRKQSITVNGVPAKSPDRKVSDTDDVRVDGEQIIYREFIYLMLNKPAGYLSATEDKHDPVVIDLIPEEYRHFNPFPVGRLDKDTEGLLLLTNDGAFDHKLTSPGAGIYKRYFARLDQPAVPADEDAFQAGMEFQDFTAKPGRLIRTENPCEVCVEIAEGKFHQVKRMCERVGKNVIYLKRVAIGGLELDPLLPVGGVRELTESDFQKLGFPKP